MPRLKDNVLARAIGTRLRAKRMAAAISQETCGAGVGITFQQVQKYESGKNLPSLVVLFKMAALYHTTVPDLIGITESGAPATPTAIEEVMADFDGCAIVLGVAKMMKRNNVHQIKIMRAVVQALEQHEA